MREIAGRARLVGALSILAVCFGSVAFMWPSLVNANWELFDDGVTLAVARHVTETGTFDSFAEDLARGRFRPGYFLYYVLLYQLFGLEPTWYFVAQAVVLCLTALLLGAAVRRMTGRLFPAALAVLLLFSASVVVEPYHTLSKAETTFTLLMAVFLYGTLRSFGIGERRRPETVPKWGWLVAAEASLLGAYITKETGVLVFGASLLCLAFVFLVRRSKLAFPGWTLPLVVGILNGLTTLIFLGWGYLYKGARLPAGTTAPAYHAGLYVSVERLFALGHLAFDVYVLALLASVGLVWAVLGRRLGNDTLAIVVFCSVNGLIYLFFLTVLFEAYSAYYFLPAVFWIIAGLTPLWHSLAAWRWSLRIGRICLVSAVFLVLLSRVYSVPAVWNSIVGLNAWNEVNGELLRWVGKLPDRTALFSNGYGEYRVEIPLLAKLLHRRSNLTCGDTAALDPPEGSPQVYVLINDNAPANYYVWARGLHPAGISAEMSVDRLLPPGRRASPVFRASRQATVFFPWAPSLETFRLSWTAYLVAPNERKDGCTTGGNGSR